MQKFSKATGKPCMFISFEWDRIEDLDEIVKAAPYLHPEKCENIGQIMSDECSILIFESEEEMQDAFAHTVGDDGPTKLNPYDGPVRVYALTCINGELMAENT